MASHALSTSETDGEGEFITFYDPQFDARRAIEREIQRLEERIQQLQVQRNSLIPISALPTEVLTEIFALSRRRKYGLGTEMRYLLPVTWVCHHWRDVALSCGPLWAHIDRSNLGWALQAIERSNQAGLTAWFSVDDEEVVGVIEMLLSHVQVHRVRKIGINVNISYPFGEAWTKPAPILESFYASDSDIPIHLFSGIAPSLHDLGLSRCTFTPDFLPLSRLRSLSLSELPRLIPLTALLEMISAIPGLEVLSLDEAFESDPQASTPQLPTRLFLKNIRDLHIITIELRPAVNFFEKVIIPSTAQITGEAMANGNNDPFVELFDISKSLKRRVVSMGIKQDDKKPGSSVVIKCGVNLPDSNSFNYTAFHSLSLPSLNDLLLDFPLDDIQNLTIQVQEGETHENWTNFVTAFPNIRTLRLRGGPAMMLFIDFISSIPPESQSYPLPHLREVALCDANDGIQVFSEIIFQRFCDALKTRCDHGFSLMKLQMDKAVFHLHDWNEVMERIVMSGFTGVLEPTICERVYVC
ncbi:hypothetical protein BDN72DRAFT_841972 [Pluteus cervinus]|uniref:Uncharacterized protein n=1 Tax=Pluteus cervinus TaxID=181527 RepID=A0ACD3ARP2_9AGAR|nr:hypothetical protein BDN72DRAFT_841972 [Pluteus cervinus]